MKIAIDVTPMYDKNRLRGVGVYTKRLFENLLKVDKENIYITFKRGDTIPKSDLVHYPYFDPFFLTLPLLKKYLTVVTIHDMIPFVFPDEFSRGVKGEIKWHIQKLSLKSVQAIITDSQCSKMDLLKFTGIDGKKVNVIYLASSIGNIEINERLKKEVKEKFHLPDKFLLYIGDINYNKNIPRLFEALHLLGERIHLVLVGNAFLDKKLKEKNELDEIAKKLTIEDNLTRVGVIKEEELVAFYKLAYAYIHPSLYEGFGLPVLDAMCIGCPVITSQEGSLGEITNNAAIFVDPHSSQNIAHGINKLFHYNKVEYNSMIKKGKENSSRFSWEKTARETIKVYHKVLD